MYYKHFHTAQKCVQSICEVANNNPHWTEQFQSIGVGLGGILAGVGGILAGLGGLKVGSDWLHQQRLKRKVSRLTQRYPIDKIDKEYKLVETKEVKGKWWLIDLTNETRHWVRNLETARDMGWSYDMLSEVKEKDIKKYPVGEHINTRDL